MSQKKLHLLFLNRLEDLDDTSVFAGDIDALKHLTVFSPPHFANNFIVVLIAGNKKKK